MSKIEVLMDDGLGRRVLRAGGALRFEGFANGIDVMDQDFESLVAAWGNALSVREGGQKQKRPMGRPKGKNPPMQVCNIRMDADLRAWVDSHGGASYVRGLIEQDRAKA